MNQHVPTPVRRWTIPEMNKVESMFMRGCPDSEIAQAVGRHVESVRSKRQLMGLDGHLLDRRRSANPLRVRLATRQELAGARPCPVDAEYAELVRANYAYLIDAVRAGHDVFFKARGPE